MQCNSIARRSVVGAMEKNNERRIRRISNRFERDSRVKGMTYIKYIIIYVDISSLTNKVEEHCAFPSLLSLICGYLRWHSSQAELWHFKSSISVNCTTGLKNHWHETDVLSMPCHIFFVFLPSTSSPTSFSDCLQKIWFYPSSIVFQLILFPIFKSCLNDKTKTLGRSKWWNHWCFLGIVLQTVPISPPQLMNQIEIRVAEIELAWAKLRQLHQYTLNSLFR